MTETNKKYAKVISELKDQFHVCAPNQDFRYDVITSLAHPRLFERALSSVSRAFIAETVDRHNNNWPDSTNKKTLIHKLYTYASEVHEFCMVAAKWSNDVGMEPLLSAYSDDRLDVVRHDHAVTAVTCLFDADGLEWLLGDDDIQTAREIRELGSKMGFSSLGSYNKAIAQLYEMCLMGQSVLLGLQVAYIEEDISGIQDRTKYLKQLGYVQKQEKAYAWIADHALNNWGISGDRLDDHVLWRLPAESDFEHIRVEVYSGWLGGTPLFVVTLPHTQQYFARQTLNTVHII